MNMSNIMFEVPRSSTFVFKKCSEKNLSRLNIVISAQRVLAGIMLAQRRISIRPMYRVSGAGIESVTRRAIQQSENTVQSSPNTVSMRNNKTLRKHCENYTAGPVFSYKLRYIVVFGLAEMDISTNPKPTIYRNLYENTSTNPVMG